MNVTLPFLISIPHGGSVIPDYLMDHCLLEQQDILIDSDTCSREIYDLAGTVCKMVTMDLARCVLDVNRSRDQLPPRFPDGLIKERSVTGKKVFSLDLVEEKAILEKLLKRYDEFQREIASAVKEKHLVMAFDCHTMMPEGPAVSPDPEEPRPLVNLGNNFGKSCPDDLTRSLAEFFIEVMGVDDKDVTINKPFSGGYLTRHYGMSPLPWIQIELNKSLYMQPRGNGAAELEPVDNAVAGLNKQIIKVLMKFHKANFEKEPGR